MIVPGPKKASVRKTVCYILAFAGWYLLMVLTPFLISREVTPAFIDAFNIDAFRGGDTGQRALILDDPDESFDARLEILALAQKEIRIATFDVTDDRSTRLIFGAAFSAMRRGVRIELLVDGKFAVPSGRIAFIADAVRAYGGGYYEYSPLNLLAPVSLNDSLHDKYFAVDDRYLILGGRNIGDRYFGIGKNAANDRDVLVFDEAGSDAVRQVNEYFDETAAARQTRKKEKGFAQKAKAALDAKIDALIGEYRVYAATTDSGLLEKAIPVGRVTLVHNPVESGKKRPELYYTYKKLVELSDDCILQTPYTALTAEKRDEWIELGNRTGFTLLTNSLASSPNLPAFSQYLNARKRYAASGMRIYEYQSETDSIHAKTLVAGDDLTVIGSFNLDERSIHIDTESALVIEGAAFNAAMREVLGRYIDRSASVAADGSYAGGAAAVPVSGGKNALFRAAGAVIRPFVFLT